MYIVHICMYIMLNILECPFASFNYYIHAHAIALCADNLSLELLFCIYARACGRAICDDAAYMKLLCIYA